MLPLLAFYGITWFSVIYISDRAINDTLAAIVIKFEKEQKFNWRNTQHK